ncbi:hypothetical protein Patl1_24561 [Pistacia atlantica]|uniref:Uncharacterized protein n=1 Tax=Pistacia atlantica TaxID=434234 RepID=A0ACC0ZXC9_9ROSI|nr:hypothetical protein Patl1_24561 [Pistacia atlantica]
MVESIIVKAEELIRNQSSIGTDRNIRYQNSNAASELMVDDIGPLLQQEVKFDRVSYPTIPLEKNFDKLRDDVLKLKNARLKVQRKVDEAKNNVEEIEEAVKKWLEDVDSIIVKSEELIENQSDYVIQACELNSLPKDVCKECGGLPIVICTIAKALRNKSRPSAWKVALQELKAPSPTKFIGFLEKEYVKIALSYNYLRNDELKKTFLISSLMKNNSSISNLFRHVVGMDILEGANLKMEDARVRLDNLVCELKDSCLLLDGFTEGQFAMHDVIQVHCYMIAYLHHHVFTERNDVEKEWKDKDKLKKCTKISLPHSSTIISQLWPKDLDCPNLEYFYMSNTWNTSFQIPQDFFTVMPKLKVLNLFEMQQSSLPLSLDLLANLQTLCLDQSRIEDVVIIGKLKKLKVLSLRQSYIKELPTEIGQLTQLKILDLRYCWQLKCIAPNVISKLLQLEELYIKGCCIQWKVEIVEEFKHLTQVTTLTLDIKDDIVLPQGFFPRDIKRYEISIGHWQLDPQERECTRVLKFKFNSIHLLRGFTKNQEC